MKYLSLAVCSLLFLQCTSQVKNKAVAFKTPAHYKDITYPDFHYTTPHPKDYIHSLSNGSRVFLYPDSSLPTIDLQMVFLDNNLSNDPKEVSTLSLLSPMYRRGGTEALSPYQVEDSLEFISAKLGGGLGNFRSTAYLNVMDKDFSNTLTLLRDFFTKPRFDSTQLELLKGRIKQNIRHKWDKPSQLSKDFYSYLMYGDHPSNWSFSEEEIQTISQQDLFSLSQGRFNPSNVILGVSGKFDPKKMLIQLEALLKEWSYVPKPTSKELLPLYQGKAGIHIIDHPATQAQVRLGQAFIKRPHPDYYPATLASYILGSGGFTSRLTAKIRTEEGLVYGIRSFTGSNYDYQATAGVQFQTKVNSCTRALDLTFAEIEKLTSEGPSSEELQRAKDGLIASLPQLFDTPSSTIDAFVYSESRGRNHDHFVDYPKALEKVSIQDIQRVLKKYFSRDKMIVSIVGPKTELLLPDAKHGTKLEDLGPIQWHTTKELEVR